MNVTKVVDFELIEVLDFGLIFIPFYTVPKNKKVV